VMLHHPTRPELAHHRNHFIRASAARLEVLFEQLELVFHPADTDPERHAAAGDEGRRAHGLGYEEWVAHRQNKDVREKLELWGGDGHRADRHPGVRPWRVG